MLYSCSKCYLCTGEFFWFVFSWMVLFLLGILMVSIHLLLRSLENGGDKLQSKFKILCTICHAFYVIAILSLATLLFFQNHCRWDVIFEYKIWHLTYAYQFATSSLLLLFTERLYSALKDSIFELKKWIRYVLYAITCVQMMLASSIVIMLVFRDSTLPDYGRGR